MTEKQESPETNSENVPFCVLTKTGRFKTIGYIAISSFCDVGKAMVEVVRLLEDFNDYEGKPERLDELISATNQFIIDNGFEVGLINEYFGHKVNPRSCICGCCSAQAMIEKFVEIIGLTNFSEYFQTEWNKLQPVTYYFGSTEFVIGEDLNSPIDILIDLLDELDDRRLELDDGDILPDYHMAHIRSVLGEWSPVLLTLNELIRMSEVEDKSCSGCEFVRKLVDRVGLENLPPKTKELYAKVFLPN